LQTYRRGGFTGPIAISVEGLPPGVTCPAVSIPAGEHQASIVLTAVILFALSAVFTEVRKSLSKPSDSEHEHPHAHGHVLI
jgi:hypothetical protein